MSQRYLRPILLGVVLCRMAYADNPAVVVDLQTAEVPHLKPWGDQSKVLIDQWYPRIRNLLPANGQKPPQRITLRLRKSDEGIGETSGTTITVYSHWIEKHPEDLGLVLHELVHVIQAYPSGHPWWVTEGIADYLRWGIYEGKDQAWFPRPSEKQGYKKGYQVAAGFLMWLENEISPGIVKKLNAAMRSGTYSDDLFQKVTKLSLDQLWDQYVAQR